METGIGEGSHFPIQLPWITFGRELIVYKCMYGIRGLQLWRGLKWGADYDHNFVTTKTRSAPRSYDITTVSCDNSFEY